MHKATRPNGWKRLATASMLVVALIVSGCGRLPALPGGSGQTTASADDPTAATQVATPDVASGSGVTAIPAATAAARPGSNQPVPAHRGSIAQTLTLIGRVVAPEEVPLSFGERLAVKSVQAKSGQPVEAGQVLITADSTDIQRSLEAATAILDGDTAGLAQAEAGAVARQQAIARQAAADRAAQADRVAAAQANLGTARANLERLLAGPSPADLQSAQNGVLAAQIALRKAEADQAKVTDGPDLVQMRSAEQELANAQAAVARAQADLDKMPGAQTSDTTITEAARPAPIAAENISPAGVSTDGNSPANNYGFQAIAVDAAQSGTVYVGTSYQGLWKTTDGGGTWAKVNTGTNGKALDSGRLWLVVVDPVDSAVYAAPGYGVGGLWKSNDRGVSWTALFPANSPVTQQLGAAPTPSNLAIDPANHLHMIASSHFPWGGKYSSFNGAGVLETNDGGNTWTIHDPIQNSGAEHQVALLNSATWLDSFAGGTYRTTDSGANWTKASSTNGEMQNLIVANGALYLPALTGLMRSTDNGATWQTVGPGGMAVISDGVNLYTQQASPGGGQPEPFRYSSVNDGITWTDYSAQTMCNTSTCNGAGWMNYDAANRTIYTSNWNAGVWKLQTIGGSGSPAPPAAAPAAKANTGTSPSDVLAARQRLQTAKDAADTARARLQAVRSGADQNALDIVQLGVDTAQADLQAAQDRLDKLRRGPAPVDRRAAQDAVNQAQVALNRAQTGVGADQQDDAGGPVADIAARQKLVDKDKAEVARLQDRLAATQLIAPFSGTVVSVRVRVGEIVDETRPSATIAKPGNPLVRSTITPADFDKVSIGQLALIEMSGQAGTPPPLSATVTSLTPNDAGTAKTINLEVSWPNPVPKLGAVMNVGLVLQQREDALLVPRKALHTTGSRTFVVLVDGSNRRVTNVQLGIVGASDAEIVSGLSQGQLVAVNP